MDLESAGLVIAHVPEAFFSRDDLFGKVHIKRLDSINGSNGIREGVDQMILDGVAIVPVGKRLKVRDVIGCRPC